MTSVHLDCERAHRERVAVSDHICSQLRFMADDAFQNGIPFAALGSRVDELKRSEFIPAAQVQKTLAQAWEAAADIFLQDGLLGPGLAERLIEFKNRFDLSREDLDRNGAYLKVAKATAIRDVLNGDIPSNVELIGQLPINLKKGEQIVWAFPGAQYFEDRTRRQFIGQSSGMSVRVMKGVYYREGSFRGNTVTTTERVHVDTGLVLITDRNLYFAGPAKSVRIPYDRILTFHSFSNGLGIVRDANNAKAQFVVTGDGWFTYNLVVNLARMGAAE